MGESNLGSQLWRLSRRIDELRSKVKSETASSNDEPWLQDGRYWLHFLHESFFFRYVKQGWRHDLRGSLYGREIHKLAVDFEHLIHDEPERINFPCNPSPEAYLSLFKAHVDFLLSMVPRAEVALQEGLEKRVEYPVSMTDRGEALYQERFLTFSKVDHGRYVVIDPETGLQTIGDSIANACRAFNSQFGDGARGYVRRIGGELGEF
jgi:hypothetical protein